ncbi:DinB family protein [Bacteroidota bacterium]
MIDIPLTRPKSNEYKEYFERYISLVPEGNILTLMQEQLQEFLKFFEKINEEKSGYSYKDGKWSIKEVLGHMIDTEHIMACRALRIARNDKSSLPGFDENEFVDNAYFDKLSIASLIVLFELTRKMTIALFKSFNSGQASAIGTADDYPISVRSIAYIIVGHVTHHLKVINDRYF